MHKITKILHPMQCFMIIFSFKKYHFITEEHRIKRGGYMVESRESKFVSQRANSINYVLQKEFPDSINIKY